MWIWVTENEPTRQLPRVWWGAPLAPMDRHQHHFVVIGPNGANGENSKWHFYRNFLGAAPSNWMMHFELMIQTWNTLRKMETTVAKFSPVICFAMKTMKLKNCEMEGNNYFTLDSSSPKIQLGNYNITQHVTLSWYVSKRDFDINRLVLHPIIH